MSMAERLMTPRVAPTVTISAVRADEGRKLAGRAVGGGGIAVPEQGSVGALIGWTCWI